MILFAGHVQATSPPFQEVQYSPLRVNWSKPSTKTVGYYKIRKLIKLIAQQETLNATSSVIASSCRKNLVLSDFLDKATLALDQSSPIRKNKLPDLNQPAESVSELFKLLRTTRLGRAILDKFMPLYGYQVKISFSDKNLTTLAYYDPTQKAIFLKPDTEVGSLAPVLIHEMIHALDVDFHNGIAKIQGAQNTLEQQLKITVQRTATRMGKQPYQLIQNDFYPSDLQYLAKIQTTIEQMNAVQVFRAERFAYDASFDIWKELAQLFPSYYNPQAESVRGLSQIRHKELKGSPKYYTDEHIIESNYLNALYVKKYLSGRCTAFQASMIAPTKPD